MESHQKPNPELGSISIKQETQNSTDPKKFDLPSFKCNDCSYASIWKHAVKRHQQTHYRGLNIPPESKRKKYQCEHCSFTGNNWKKLIEHQNLHLPQKSTSRNKKEQSSSSDEDNKSNKPKHRLVPRLVPKDTEMVQPRNGTIEDPQGDSSVLDNSDRKLLIGKVEISDNRVSYSGQVVKMEEIGKDDDMLRCTSCGVVTDCEAVLKEHMKLHGQKHKVEANLNQNTKTTTILKLEKPDPILKLEKPDLTPSLNQNPTTENLLNKRSNIQDDQNLVVKTAATKPVVRTRRGKYCDVPVKTTKNGLFQCQHCSYQTAIRTALVKHQTNHLKNANS